MLAGLALLACQRHEAARAQWVDLLASLDGAERRPPDGKIAPSVVTLGRQTEPALDVPAISRIVWAVRLPDHATLSTALGASEQLASEAGGKALFRIGISDERTYDELLTTEVALESVRSWKPVTIDLSNYAGFKWSLFYRPREKTWNVIFNTTVTELRRPLGQTDRLYWKHPLIQGRE
jgi:hypothetical protein